MEYFFTCTDHGKEYNFDGISIITLKGTYISEIKEFESKYKLIVLIKKI